eukprot:TRINITY_DN7300_c0_g1_i2.p1 TRINITY_DN7300_c0_g1~~TRINITY_DN7300_c0_g1_i2.p1  ORF type:complete len:128 (+),score=13.58 TRINITY_DN7300_c0_g1_i2:80-463(+)
MPHISCSKTEKKFILPHLMQSEYTLTTDQNRKLLSIIRRHYSKCAPPKSETENAEILSLRSNLEMNIVQKRGWKSLLIYIRLLLSVFQKGSGAEFPITLQENRIDIDVLDKELATCERLLRLSEEDI